RAAQCAGTAACARCPVLPRLAHPHHAGTGGPMSHGLDDATAHRLLKALATDDTFRDRFAAGPDAALASLGYQGEVRIGACISLPRPDKRAFADAHDLLHAQLTSTLSLKVFRL